MIDQTESLVLPQVSADITDVEVFRTNVVKISEAARLVDLLTAYFPDCSFNLDLADCDKILRAKGKYIDYYKSSVMDLVTAAGYKIEILPE